MERVNSPRNFERFNVNCGHNSTRTSVSINKEICIYFAAAKGFKKWDGDARMATRKFLEDNIRHTVSMAKGWTLSNCATSVLLAEIVAAACEDKNLLGKALNLRAKSYTWEKAKSYTSQI